MRVDHSMQDFDYADLVSDDMLGAPSPPLSSRRTMTGQREPHVDLIARSLSRSQASPPRQCSSLPCSPLPSPTMAHRIVAPAAAGEDEEGVARPSRAEVAVPTRAAARRPLSLRRTRPVVALAAIAALGAGSVPSSARPKQADAVG